MLLLQLQERRTDIVRSLWAAKVLANAEQAADQLEKLLPPPPPSSSSANLRRRASLEATNQVQRQLLTAGGLHSLELVLQCVGEHLKVFRPLNTVTALVWSARISPSSKVGESLGIDKRFMALCGKLRSLAPEMSGGMLGSSVWSMAKLGFKDETLLAGVAEKAAGNMAMFHPTHLMRLCYGLARVRYHNQKLLDKLPVHALVGHGSLPAVDLCTILWAFVEFGLTKAHPSTFCKILDRLLLLLQKGMVRAKQAEEDSAQEAAAKAPPVIHPSDLVRLVVAMIPSGSSSPQKSACADRLLVVAKVFMRSHWNLLAAADFCGLLWAYAKTSRWIEAAEMLTPLMETFTKELQDVSADIFSAAVWALGVISSRGGVDLRELISKAGPVIREHSLRSLPLLQVPEQLVALIWGLVTAGLDAEKEVLKQAGDLLEKLLHGSQPEPDKPVGAGLPPLGDRDYPPASLCCLLWSFAAQGLRHAKLFETIEDLLVSHAMELRWADLADALWACAVTDLECQGLATATAQRVVAEDSEVRSVSFADLVRVAWSLTASELRDYQLVVSAMRLLLPQQTLTGSLGSNAEGEQPQWVWPLLQQVLILHDCFGDRQHSQWLDLSTQNAQSLGMGREGARLRKKVCSILADSGSVSEEAEAILASGATQLTSAARLPVDVALPLRKLALDAECQAFTVFDLEHGATKPNGVAHLRRECLEREGWTFRLVPESAFASRKGCAGLKEILKQHPRQS